MHWDPQSELALFNKVAALIGIQLTGEDITIDLHPAPHEQPKHLPARKIAAYVFSRGNETLKVGMACSNSEARYTSQHYTPRGNGSTLAKSMLKNKSHPEFSAYKDNVGEWIKANVDRVNLLVDASVGLPVLKFLEAFLQYRLNPRYEGRRSQRASPIADQSAHLLNQH